MKLIITAILIVIFFVFGSFAMLLAPNNYVVKPQLLTGSGNGVLEKITILDNCNDVQCSNVYIVTSKTSAVITDFHYCQNSFIKDGVYITDPNYKDITKLGSTEKCEIVYSRKVMACKPRQKLSRFSFYSVFPIPKKVSDDFYFCVTD